MPQTLYTCRPAGPSLYAIAKLDGDLEVLASYLVGTTICDCPAGHRLTCRHRDMLRDYFLHRQHVGDGWFLVWETKMWKRPLGQDESPAGAPDGPYIAEVIENPAFALAQGNAVPLLPPAGEKIPPASPAGPIRRRF